MLKRVLGSRLPLMVYNPPKVFDLDYFTRCHKAGALPVLDTEFLTNTEVIAILDRLAAQDLVFGLRLPFANQALRDYLTGAFQPRLDLVVLTYRAAAELSSAAPLEHYRTAVEVRDIDLLAPLKTLEPHALVVRGNEAPGRVSRYSSFVLMQWYLENGDLPVFVHGGVGWHTAAGLFAAGASGIVLDDQLYLAAEAPLAEAYKSVLRRLEDKDSAMVGETLNAPYRFFAKLATRVVKELKAKELGLAGTEDPEGALYREIEARAAALDQDAGEPLQSLFYLGQDAVFARHFAARASGLEGMIQGLFTQIGAQLAAVDDHNPLRPGSKLADIHGTRYPIVQGPMANVSDNADFAAAVLAAGGLPFLALGSLPAHLAENILTAGTEKVQRFGAGMIGIETFNQTIGAHLEAVKRHRVPFALFAGGLPAQVKELEAVGTKTYLHTPSASMLENALQNGCRRFIFEGAEAGGHVGSLSSLVLWELGLEVLQRLPDDRLAEISVLFAGGIGTARAAHFVSGLASQLAGRGAAVGIQVGTAYLFTCEIVETGAIKKVYQDTVCRLNETIVMGTTVGLASRTVATPFSRRMIENERQRLREGLPLSERKTAFEHENIGALLIGAKAFCPDFEKLKTEGQVCLIHYDDEEQFARGNFMVGDALAFHPCTTTIARIHAAFFESQAALHRTLNALEIATSPRGEIEDEIAVIGMGCILPGADSPQALWERVLAKHYAIAPMPEERLDPALYYDPDRKAEDKSYTRLAGVVADFTFDHARFGYTPEKAARLSRSQQMMLQCAYQALADAGYLEADDMLRSAWRASTAVIVASCLGNELGNDLHLKYWYPELKHELSQIEAFQALDDAARTACLERLREGLTNGLDYEPVHGQLLNIEASRIAHHLGAEGVNYVVDAACATSLAALDCAVRELLAGEADLVVTGGVNTNLAPESFVGFCKMGALSATGSYPFDSRADGFVLGEGAGALVLKRMKDARRDGDRVLGVIKGVGASSDGKGKAIAAPNPKGQALALRRCFAKIRGGVTTADIGYIEAHGTSTVAGDQAELETLREVYADARAIGVSSIKSQIGHLLGGAGCAGLIKALLALQHRTLPPNGGFATLAPAHRLEGSPLYIIRDAAPWEAPGDRPRRAAVSSYGFGGINYHCVVEEARDDYRPLPRRIFADLDFDHNDRRLVFAGLGVVLPESPDVEAFWRNLEQGRTVLSTIPPERFHNAAYAAEPEDSPYHIPMVQAGVVRDWRFDNARFRIPPKTARSIDRAQLFALDAAAQAVASAGLDGQLAAGNRVAVILGTLPGTRQVENILRVRLGVVTRLVEGLEDLPADVRRAIAERLAARVRDRIPENNEDTIPGLLSNIVSGRIANTLGCNGANFVVDASCASATAALRLAAMGLRSGDYDAALTGGVDANFYPTVMLAFKRLGLLSPGDCRYFDQQARGYVMSEGAAIQVLTTYRYAAAHGLPILGEFGRTSFRSSAPGHLLAPSERAYGEAIADCYRRLPVARRELVHLDVFGVANPLLDLMEKQALEAQFPRGVCFGNIKPEFGYFKSANPAVVVTKLLLMHRRQALLPNFNHRPETSIVGPGSRLSANSRLQDLQGRPLRYFAANVNGVGGNHGHTVLGALPPRLALPAQPVAQNAAVVRPRPSRPAPSKQKGLVALVSGQGAQYAGMLQPLYQSEPIIRRRMDAGDRLFRELRGYSLLELMFAGGPALNQTENTQPAVFLASAAIFAHLRERGLAPEVFIGHSVGEYTSLYCAGLLDFEDTLRLVIKRGDCMRAAAQEHPGRIMVVFQDADEVLRLIGASGIPEVWVANKNSAKQTAVSGREAAIEAFGQFLKQHNVMFKVLALSGAFHTPLFASAAARMAAELEALRFHPVDFGRVISNVTGSPYPSDEAAVKKLLVRQIVSPVEFIRAVQGVRRAGLRRFVEVGPGRILVNLLKNIPLEDYEALPAADPKPGEAASLAHLEAHLATAGLLKRTAAPAAAPTPRPAAAPAPAAAPPPPAVPAAAAEDPEFADFLKRNPAAVQEALYAEFQKHRQAQRLKELESFRFYTGPTVIAGAAIGLPGTGNKVFNTNNFDKILAGSNFIEPLSPQEKEKILDMNITRVFKQPDGSARFLDISDTREVIQLAGKLGYFNLKNEYGVDYDYDVTIALAMAAGIEALKDAQIPLVMQQRQTSTGNRIPAGFALPAEMQATTGVIMTSLFPGFETLIEQLNRYYYNKFYVRPYKELENIYYHLMESVKDPEIKEQITDWFFKIKERRKKYGTYKFERNLLFDVVPLGSAHFAQLIKARGPNMMMSGACASTTQSIGVAEDWIRTGRCERVVIIGGEASTSEVQSPWIASGFLALGAATIKNVVADAAKPFDAERNGTILGAGAVGLVVERQDRVQARGLNGQAEILGTYIGNSAYHATQIDVAHLQEEMGRFVRGVERRHGLDPDAYPRSMVFMSHETFTPARGGSASAEVASLKATYPEHFREITVTNTKGFTGHTLGAAIEDAVLVKALQQGKVPPIANLTTVPDEFAELRFSCGAAGCTYDYGLHYAAGFGSHFAFLFLRRLEEADAAGNAGYQEWLQRISGLKRPRLSLINNTLCVDPHVPSEVAAPAADAPAPAAPAAPTPAAAPPAAGVAEAVRTIIAEQTGYALDMLEGDLDLEADLGIDTVKQVEIFGKIAARFSLEVPEDLKLRDLNTIARLAAYIGARTAGAAPATPVPAAASAAATPAPAAGVAEAVRAIIAEQTGYALDMLEGDLDLEADLGIDTVKQVEIFGKIAARFSLEVPEDLKLRDLSTIARLAAYIGERTATAASAPAAAAPASAPAPAAGVAEAVRAIIAEQTGYAPDMLEGDLDLEADLGIDTVKQVEIFGKIAARFSLEVPEDLKLRDLNTIARLAAYIGARTAGAAPAAEPMDRSHTAAPPPSARPAPEDDPIGRFTIALTPAPPSPGIGLELAGKRLLVTTDGHGATALVASKIQAAGGTVVTLGPHPGADIPADLADLKALAGALETLTSSGEAIDGLIHLHPLDGYFAGAPLDRTRVDAGVKALFALIQGLFHHLDRPGTVVAAPAVNSVVFPHDAASAGPIDPIFAGVAGLLKTVRKELPQTRVKVVDWAQPDRGTEGLASLVEALLAEITGADPRVEVGYRDGQRFAPRLVETSADGGAALVRPGDTLLVTGGAHGITFEILRALAQSKSTPLHLVILGRSDLAELERHPGSDRATPAELMEQLRERLPQAKPLEIRRAQERLLRIRDIRAHLAALEAAGLRVDYHAADVTDPAAVAAVAARYPRIDAVIHAAGVEESQLISAKTAASFDRVFDTKVAGARNLLAALQDREVRTFIAFSSVTARFGNAGQADYTAANDMLGKMLLAWRAEDPRRVVRVMGWTAWEGAGMATRETVQKVLRERGLRFLPLAKGVARFLDELRDASATEVVISGRDRAFDPDGLLPPDPAAADGRVSSFLDRRLEAGPQRAVFARVLDPRRDVFLHDHAREGVPIFLGATGIEAMAQAAATLAGPGARLRELRDFAIPYGIKILKDRAKALEIEAAIQDGEPGTIRCRITSQFTNPRGVALGNPTLHYHGTCVFGRTAPDAAVVRLPEFQPPVCEGDIQALLYHPQRLFMDGLFRTVEDILSFDGRLLISRIRAAGSPPFFADGTPSDFLTDVRVVDAMFQTGGMLEVMSSNVIVLPYAIRRMVFHRPLPPGQAFLCLTERTREGDETNTYQLRLVDADGGLYLTIEDFQMVQLETLAPEHRILDRLCRQRRAS